MGSSVTNSGIITTPKGEVILAAGNSVELVNPGTPNLRVEISAPDNQARNLGDIVADAGRVGIYAGLINHSGRIRADSAVATEDGRVILRATRNATLEAGSTISANGPSGGSVTVQSGDTTLVSGSIEAKGFASPGEGEGGGGVGKGGTVNILGNLVGLTGNASINASGETGGGTVLIGGDFQGKNPDVQNAFRTFFGSSATIRADAVSNGDGGRVIVWSDDVTRAYGTISARGGSQSGDGGFVEVSSKGWLDFHAKVDLRAPKGKTGTLLLDPNDVTIGGGEGSFGGGFAGCSGVTPCIWASSGAFASFVDWSDIDNNLASANVIITTSGPGSMPGNITVVDDSPFLNSSNKLQLVAHNDINVNGNITNNGSGDIFFFAGWDGVDPITPSVLALTGNINITGVSVDTRGNVLMRAGNNIDIGSAVLAGNGFTGNWSITLDAGNRLRLKNGALVEASAGEGGTTSITMLAGAGGILVDGAAGAVTVSANSNDDCCSSLGGSASINMATFGGGSITISDSSRIEAIAGDASGGNNGGAAGVIVASSGNLSILNFAQVRASGGQATGTGSGGSANMFLGAAGSMLVNNGSNIRVEGGDANNVGSGGNALFSAVANGSINVDNSEIRVQGGITFGDGPQGGSAEAVFSAGGNINVQNNSFIFATGGEGSTGGMGRILMAANGAIMVGNYSTIQAASDFSCCSVSQVGGAADVTMIASSILINGNSTVRADGGEGVSSGGAARVDMLATGFASINIIGAEGIGAFGGAALNGRGGDATTTLISLGPVNIVDTFGFLCSIGCFATGTGIFAVAGSGMGATGIGGNAITAFGSGSLISSTNSQIESKSGMGNAGNGSALTAFTTLNGNIEILGPPDTVLACGNSFCEPDVGGPGQVFLSAGGPTGMVIINDDVVEAVGLPGAINLFFPGRTTGGWSVNGVEGAITGSPVGFFVNGLPAEPGVNFFVEYGSANAPTFDAPLLKAIDDILNILTVTEEEAGTGTPGDDKKKKNVSVCN